MKKIVLVLLLLFSVCACTDFVFDYEQSKTSPSSGYAAEDKTDFVASDDTLVAHFLDVGQADANFIELPNGETMLIDAGLSGSANDIITYIQDLGYDTIDYVIATHPHADHIGGLAKVLEAFTIGEIYMPKASTTSKTYENLLETISSLGLSIHTGTSGVEVLNTTDLDIVMVAPGKTSYTNLNNYSIILKITYGDVSFLYTGDAEEESLEEITMDITADVLKVGHHGSDTSTTKEFLAQVNPRYAIISVGSNNSYGHPASSTLSLLAEYTSNIYRTDEDGTIVVVTDGINIEVKTER